MTDNLLENNSNTEATKEAVDPRTLQSGPGGALNWMDQDSVLRDMWTQGLSPELMAEKLERSVAAIMTRAARLGLPRRFAPGRKAHQGTDGVLSVPKEKTRKVSPQKKNEGDGFSEPSFEGQEALRVCLMCLRKFRSQGRHNRICPSCKGSPEYVAGNRVPDAIFGDH